MQEFKSPKERLETIASRHLEAVAAGKSSLIVAPTHHECRSIAKIVRTSMRAKGLLGEDQNVTRLSHLGLTDAQRADAASYEPGHIVQFHKRASGGFKVAEQWHVVGHASNTVVVERNGQQRRLPLSKAQTFDVYRTEQLSVAVGDQLRVTKNFKSGGKKYRNNQLVIVTGVGEGKIMIGEDKDVIPTLSALHLDQGVAVTSHAAQGKTVDQVIVSVPVEAFSQVSQEQLYVSMSRARHAMHLVTDNKVALRAAVTRSSKRLSPWELINGVEPEKKVGISRAFNAIERMTDLQEGKRVARKTQAAVAARVAAQRQAAQEHERGRGMGR